MAERPDVEIANPIVSIMNRTADAVQKYEQNVKRKIIITDPKWLDNYPYKTTKLGGLLDLESHGFHDRFMGGQVYKLAKVHNSQFILLVNSLDETVGVYIPDENLEKLTIPVLRDLCNKFKKEYKSDTTKAELIEMLLK